MSKHRHHARLGRLLSLRAQVGDEVIGMYVVGHYGKTAYSLDIVADYEKSHFSAGNLMTWHALRWSCRLGLETFDFGGARIPSIARFKTSFGDADVHRDRQKARSQPG